MKKVSSQLPSESLHDFVDVISLVPGDVATIRIEADSFTQVYVYKLKSTHPVFEITKCAE